MAPASSAVTSRARREVCMATDETLMLNRSELPELYRTAADTAAQQQRRYLASTFFELLFLIAAAAVTFVPGQASFQGLQVDLAELGAIVAFGAALLLRLLRLILRP